MHPSLLFFTRMSAFLKWFHNKTKATHISLPKRKVSPSKIHFQYEPALSFDSLRKFVQFVFHYANKLPTYEKMLEPAPVCYQQYSSRRCLFICGTTQERDMIQQYWLLPIESESSTDDSGLPEL